MSTIQVEDNRLSLSVLLPGWANEASTLPHPAPLVEPAEMVLCRMLSFALPNYHALPAAQCLWREFSGAEHTPEHLVCASPVHVMAGSDDAQLTSVNRLNLSLEETQQMIAELNEALAEDARSFLHDKAGNWFHKGMAATALDAAPPTAVEGHPMTLALPRSDDAREWRSLWSESQMVLHQSAVNQARQSRGEPVINSVWFWGGGALPNPARDQNKDTVLFTDDPFGCGLADVLGVTRLPLDHAQQLDLNTTNYRRHIVLDTSLMHGNPDFIEQRDLGSQWGEWINALLNNDNVNGPMPASAELNGLTSCQELFFSEEKKSGSFFSRLAAVFKT